MSGSHRYARPKRKRSFATLKKAARYTLISFGISLVFAWDIFCLWVMFR